MIIFDTTSAIQFAKLLENNITNVHEIIYFNDGIQLQKVKHIQATYEDFECNGMFTRIFSGLVMTLSNTVTLHINVLKKHIRQFDQHNQ
ncbi:hypothetical protein RJD38_19090 [Vibrio scophthalmi]|uniref:Uncharacterized protein n=1 Tax=Vibrio scophthalmi TaxID=45658 RepID=A0A1C7FE36_9VIBR|nr:hypothetical protein [Vibrio scophthalmi]ANU38315.1 hypothetical protein VSVS05_03277 [Vibrio scophthalmi]